ncbi:hypothetical protein JL2886_01227 [Phaeobacter gallaeciensis]|uniref:Uncharacterized protein n=1 Tax=Phaeobacter gallaeciensis TaxID=60890 RepID=A0A1B0ZPY4_9RHOB|nr:hypothetical protein JL2886_01227 [Phaeobacter gallaeciensis]
MRTEVRRNAASICFYARIPGTALAAPGAVAEGLIVSVDVAPYNRADYAGSGCKTLPG